MKTKVITKDSDYQTMDVVFEMDTEDTCMKEWYFGIEKDESGKKITNSKIVYSKQGCNGHPKTISALIKGNNLESINVDELMKTDCFRSQSCGMTLGKCVTELLTNDELEFESEK